MEGGEKERVEDSSPNNNHSHSHSHSSSSFIMEDLTPIRGPAQVQGSLKSLEGSGELGMDGGGINPIQNLLDYGTSIRASMRVRSSTPKMSFFSYDLDFDLPPQSEETETGSDTTITESTPDLQSDLSPTSTTKKVALPWGEGNFSRNQSHRWQRNLLLPSSATPTTTPTPSTLLHRLGGVEGASMHFNGSSSHHRMEIVNSSSALLESLAMGRGYWDSYEREDPPPTAPRPPTNPDPEQETAGQPGQPQIKRTVLEKKRASKSSTLLLKLATGHGSPRMTKSGTFPLPRPPPPSPSTTTSRKVVGVVPKLTTIRAPPVPTKAKVKSGIKPRKKAVSTRYDRDLDLDLPTSGMVGIPRGSGSYGSSSILPPNLPKDLLHKLEQLISGGAGVGGGGGLSRKENIERLRAAHQILETELDKFNVMERYYL